MSKNSDFHHLPIVFLFIFINLLKPDVPSVLKKDYLTIASQVSETLMRRPKESHYLISVLIK